MKMTKDAEEFLMKAAEQGLESIIATKQITMDVLKQSANAAKDSGIFSITSEDVQSFLDGVEDCIDDLYAKDYQVFLSESGSITHSLKIPPYKE